MKSILAVLAVLFIPLFSLSADLKEPSNKADYLIIAPKSFENTLQYFIGWRTQKGLNVKFCSTEEIYSEFNGNLSEQEAIRSFVSYAFENWQSPKVKYTLLAGGINLIPSFKIASKYTSLGEDSISSDRLFGITGSDFNAPPSLMVGRIPARNESELIDFINKIIKFEDDFNFSDYKFDLTVLTEKKGPEGDLFIQLAEQIKNKHFVNANYKLISTKSDTNDPQIRTELINTINNGTLFLCNIMHANMFHWGYSEVFADSGIDNTLFSGPPLIFTAITSNQNCYYAESKSLLEQLLIKGSGGAVASLTSTGLAYLTSNQDVVNSFFANLISKKVKTMGEAVQDINNSNYFVYFGDPALANPYRLTAGTPDNSLTCDEILVFPNPVSDVTHLLMNLKGENIAKVAIYDLIGGLMKDFGDITSLDGTPLNFDLSDFQTGIYLLKIQTNQRTIIRQIIKK